MLNQSSNKKLQSILDAYTFQTQCSFWLSFCLSACLEGIVISFGMLGSVLLHPVSYPVTILSVVCLSVANIFIFLLLFWTHLFIWSRLRHWPKLFCSAYDDEVLSWNVKIWWGRLGSEGRILMSIIYTILLLISLEIKYTPYTMFIQCILPYTTIVLGSMPVVWYTVRGEVLMQRQIKWML